MRKDALKTEGKKPSVFDSPEQEKRWKKFVQHSRTLSEKKRNMPNSYPYIHKTEHVAPVLREIARRQTHFFKCKHLDGGIPRHIKRSIIDFLIELNLVELYTKRNNCWVYRRLFNPEHVDQVIQNAETKNREKFLQHLQEVKKRKTVKRCGVMQTSQRVLFKILYEYLKYQNKLDSAFKIRWFHNHFGKTQNGRPLFSDCPLTIGELRHAVRWGYEHGYLTWIGNNHIKKWRFTDEAKEGKLKIHV